MKKHLCLALMSAALCSTVLAQRSVADSFGSALNTFNIEFITIGNPSNVADSTGAPNPAGSVAVNYRIGKFEISEQMIDKANNLGGLGITKDTRGPNKPATNVSWVEATKFVNWLNTSTSGTPAYKFDASGNFQLWQPGDAGYNPNNLYRNSLAQYFLPSIDEWYKAAYHNPSGGNYFNFATGSDSVPTPVASGTAAGTAVFRQSAATGPADVTLAGGLSPYGTMGQGGNVFEWEETDFDLINDASTTRDYRGGSWNTNFNAGISSSSRLGASALSAASNIGFRVASAPEPTRGDFDRDGDVDGRDFLVWQRGGSPNPRSGSDLAVWQDNYGSGPISAFNVVPEPCSLVLCMLANLELLRRRRPLAA